MAVQEPLHVGQEGDELLVVAQPLLRIAIGPVVAVKLEKAGFLAHVLLDPVYSGKGAAGLIDLIRRGEFRKDERIVFIHTGGAVALFGYNHAFPYKEQPSLKA